MSVRVAEYFGQKTKDNPNIIKPTKGKGGICPFMKDTCVKLNEGKKPICVVEQKNGEAWIVCRHRLCATKRIELMSYQKELLYEVAKCVYGDDVLLEDIAVRQEENIPVIDNISYHADYVMKNIGPRGRITGQKNIVLEMQGGGETSSTGSITRHVEEWENNPLRTNEELSQFVSANPIVTNAWRRQQEQFLIKGNIVQLTGGGMVFCVGHLLYDYLWQRVRNAGLRDLKAHNWTLAIIAFNEISEPGSTSLHFKIDPQRVLFTNYLTFVQTLINQGQAHPKMFEGQFESLSGKIIDS